MFELTSLFQDFMEHRQQIFTKFVAIMKERVDNLFKNFRVDINAPKPSKSFVDLVKKTGVLHRVLLPIVTREQLIVCCLCSFICFTQAEFVSLLPIHYFHSLPSSHTCALCSFTHLFISSQFLLMLSQCTMKEFVNFWKDNNSILIRRKGCRHSFHFISFLLNISSGCWNVLTDSSFDQTNIRCSIFVR